MKTKVVKVNPDKPKITEIAKAARIIDAGGLVGFPTETVYGIACRVKTESLNKLDKLKCRQDDKYYSLHIGDKSGIGKFVPSIGLKAKKVIENAWPGPVTIVFELNEQDIEKQKQNLQKDVFECLYKNNSIGIRCPENNIATILLNSTKNPVVAPSANISGQEPATQAQQVLAQFSGQIELLLDAGPCKYKKSSTVVKIGKKGMQILRAGVYSQQELETMSEVQILFVCTGNTCRSPMAEGMFSKYLAEKLGCGVDDLIKIGYKIISAGVMGMVGVPVSPEAVTACAAKGIDIKAHKSIALSQKLVEESDLIFVMARVHRKRVVDSCPQAANRCFLLAENEDIFDPIGQGQEAYNNCAQLIEEAVKKRIGEILL